MNETWFDEFPKVEPEVVALGDQTLEEVQAILNGEKEAEKASTESFKKTIKNFREAKPCPEVVALGGQTIDEVKKLLKCKITSSNFKDCENKAYKLTFDRELSSCSIPDINNFRNNCKFKQNVDEFALWRKLAEVGGYCKLECEKPDFDFDSNDEEFASWRRLADVKISSDSKEDSPTQNLMDHILFTINSKFSNFNLKWESCWNPSLVINECKTKISAEKLNIAYQGLLNITNEANAKEITCNIIIKKISELFV